MKLYKHHCGLAIMRLQPLHFGHGEIIRRMIKECRIPVLAIGSAQESRTYGNPFTFKERKAMVYNFWSPKLLPYVIPLKDIFNLGAWARYALDSVEKKVKTKVNIYYCGNDQDGALFMKEGIKVAINDRDTGIYSGWSASKVRSLILAGNSDWKHKVPAFNIKMIQKIYGRIAK